MVRQLCLEFPGALYHITARGNARADIFVDDEAIHFFPPLRSALRASAGSATLIAGRARQLSAELCRYVVLNTVRAKMVRDVARYGWSSYPATGA